MNKVIELIGAPTDVGAADRGASMGPEALRVAGITQAKSQGEHQRSCAGDEPQVARMALKPLAKTGRPGRVTSAEGVFIRAVDHRTPWRQERADPEARVTVCR